MTGKRAVYVQVLGLIDEDSRAFRPVHDECESKVKKIDDRLIRLVDDYAAKYSAMTDADAQRV